LLNLNLKPLPELGLRLRLRADGKELASLAELAHQAGE